jgi:hypothetical protein
MGEKAGYEMMTAARKTKNQKPKTKNQKPKKTADCSPDTLQAERGLPPYLRYCAPLIECSKMQPRHMCSSLQMWRGCLRRWAAGGSGTLDILPPARPPAHSPDWAQILAD